MLAQQGVLAGGTPGRCRKCLRRQFEFIQFGKSLVNTFIRGELNRSFPQGEERDFIHARSTDRIMMTRRRQVHQASHLYPISIRRFVRSNGWPGVANRLPVSLIPEGCIANHILVHEGPFSQEGVLR